MATLFAITAATNTVVLDANQRGATSLTVSNIAGRALRGRARLAVVSAAPIPPAQVDPSAWLTIDGAAERDFAIAATEQIKVAIAPPAKAPPGSYTFRLDLVNVANPDEDVTQGPTLAFEVKAKEASWLQRYWWVLLLIAIVVIGGIVAAILFWPRKAAVPNVAGLSFADARATLVAAGLKSGEQIVTPDVAVAAGVVIASTPAPGVELARGGEVILVISGGPLEVTIADVSGQSEAAARSALEGACDPRPCLAVSSRSEASTGVAAGNVIRSEPAAGTKARQGSALTLVVSSGPSSVTLSDVTGMVEADAKQTLENLCDPKPCLVVASVGEASGTASAGTILRTVPAAGSNLLPGSSVVMVVASSAPLGTVLDHFVGAWVNADSNTGGMTVLDIEKIDDFTATFHGYGACSPQDCDWGVINAGFTPPVLQGVYDFGFKTTRITVQRVGDQLQATVFDDYTEADGRTDRTSTYTMNRKFRIFDVISDLRVDPAILRSEMITRMIDIAPGGN